MGSNTKKKDKEDKSKHLKNQYEQSSEGELLSKKSKKHKHKKSKDKILKKAKKKLQQSLGSESDITFPEDSPDQILDVTSSLGGVADIEIGCEDEVIAKISKSKSEHSSKTKKSKKKDKSKDRGEKKRKKCDGVGGGGELVARGEGRPEKGGGEETDSEEERWLHAIESGRLEEVDDELKRMRNPRLLTARQRALLEKQRTTDGGEESVATPPENQHETPPSDQEHQQPDYPIIPPEPLLALPSGFKEKVVTQEMLDKKAIKSQRRREQALEKREEDKKKTVDRLLKKQDPKLLKGGYNSKKLIKSEVAMLCYRNTRDGALLSLPVGWDYPIAPQVTRISGSVQFCGVAGCNNPKRYSCSKTGVPLCSLQCYNSNAASATQQAAMT